MNMANIEAPARNGLPHVDLRKLHTSYVAIKTLIPQLVTHVGLSSVFHDAHPWYSLSHGPGTMAYLTTLPSYGTAAAR